MIPYWYVVLAVAAGVFVGWFIRGGRLREERQLRQAAEEEARQASFDGQAPQAHAQPIADAGDPDVRGEALGHLVYGIARYDETRQWPG